MEIARFTGVAADAIAAEVDANLSGLAHMALLAG
jgi:hypothetical protein